MINLTSSEKAALIYAAENIKVSPFDLYALILGESTWNPKIVNKYGYGGLIQFGAAAAKDLGYKSVSDLISKHSTRISQLKDPVIKYFLHWRSIFEKNGKLKKGELLSKQDLVALCFYPAHFRQNDKILPKNVQDKNFGIYSINNYISRVFDPKYKANPLDIKGFDKGIVKGTAKGITFLLALIAGVFYISRKK